MEKSLLSKILGRRKGDFSNIAKVLKKEKPSRPTLFEFSHNSDINTICCEWLGLDVGKFMQNYPEIGLCVPAFVAMGYDYATIPAMPFTFLETRRVSKASCAMSHGGVIHDAESFEKFIWPEVNPSVDYIERLSEILPDGMQFIVKGPGGVLENVIQLVGYEDLCLLMFDDRQLVEAVFQKVGQTLVEYYSFAVQHKRVGAIISNDDWGFNTQTMLSAKDLRRLVFPWHKKIVQIAHASGIFAILHSCGQLCDVWEDIIEDMKFDAKHSYEDNILPVENAYDQYKGRIAILGGIDLDFICRADGTASYRRAKEMLERSKDIGGYALGTGNSVPHYVPMNNFFQIIRACVE